jgi:predicted transcriptional regulator
MATSIKLPEDLKKRIARVVRGTDQSAHAFMVEADPAGNGARREAPRVSCRRIRCARGVPA